MGRCGPDFGGGWIVSRACCCVVYTETRGPRNMGDRTGGSTRSQQKDVQQHERKEGLAHHRRWSRLGRRHRQGRAGRRPRRCRHRPRSREGRGGGRATTTTCWRSNSMSPVPRCAGSSRWPRSTKFGRIDVLVNNAGNFFAGFFEELSPEQFRAQIETLLFGPMNVTRAALPVMRKQRSGLLLTISSTAGIAGRDVLHGLCRREVRHRGVDGVAHAGDRPVRNPHDAGRARFLPHRAAHAGLDHLRQPSIDDYAERTEEIVAAWKSMDGKQGGDPAKLADALVNLAGSRSRRPASLPAPTPCRRSRGRPRTSSPRPTPTASCPAASPSIRLVRPNQFDLKAEQPIEQPKDWSTMGPFTRRWTRSVEVATPWTSCLRLVMRRSGVRFPKAAPRRYV